MQEDDKTEVFRIGSAANVRATASAVLSFFREGKKDVEIQAVGAGAVNQAFKIVVHAGAQMSREGKILLTKCGMKNIVSQEKDISVAIMRFEIR